MSFARTNTGYHLPECGVLMISTDKYAVGTKRHDVIVLNDDDWGVVYWHSGKRKDCQDMICRAERDPVAFWEGYFNERNAS